MRFAGALVLAVVLVAVVETRPPREKRGLKICSARDVKFMATFVCNLHKRSVRSVDADDFDLPETDDDLALLGPARNVPRPPICNENGRDCGRQIDASDLTNTQLNYLQAWLAENGYIPTMSDDRSLPLMTENHRPSSRIIENGGNARERGDFKTRLEGYAPIMGNLKGGVAKRDREIDWPLVPSMTLGDIRKNCCVRQCRVEDFYGACS